MRLPVEVLVSGPSKGLKKDISVIAESLDTRFDDESHNAHEMGRAGSIASFQWAEMDAFRAFRVAIDQK